MHAVPTTMGFAKRRFQAIVVARLNVR